MPRITAIPPLIELVEVPTVPPPKAKTVQLFSRLSTDSKYQLCILLPNGIVGIIWTQE